MKNQNTPQNLTSILSYPERGEGGNNKYRGNCSPRLIEDLLRHFNVQQVCDYMCGSNSTASAAGNLGIDSRTYDLHSGFDLLNCDIHERPQFIFWHPPYFDIIKYSDVMYKADDVQRKYGYDPRQSDLSRIPDWNDFVKALNYCLMKQFTSLEKGGRMAALVGDIKKKGRLLSMVLEMMKPGKLENIIIKTQHNCVSDKTAYSGRFIPIVHEYVVIMQKDQPFMYPVLLTNCIPMDLRDMPGATWKDIVADAMEAFRGPAALESIYAKVEGYRRTREQAYWKEKVRQTLQYYPDLFNSPERGVWSLHKYAA